MSHGHPKPLLVRELAFCYGDGQVSTTRSRRVYVVVISVKCLHKFSLSLFLSLKRIFGEPSVNTCTSTMITVLQWGTLPTVPNNP